MIQLPAETKIETLVNAWIVNMANATGQQFSYKKQGKFLLVMMGDLPVNLVDVGGACYEAKFANSFPGSAIRQGAYDGSLKNKPFTPVAA